MVCLYRLLYQPLTKLSSTLNATHMVKQFLVSIHNSFQLNLVALALHGSIITIDVFEGSSWLKVSQDGLDDDY